MSQLCKQKKSMQKIQILYCKLEPIVNIDNWVEYCSMVDHTDCQLLSSRISL